MKKKPLIITTLLISVIILAIILWLTMGGKKPGVNARGYNLLIITLDTTRDDHIGAYGYEKAITPNLDKLAKEGTLFENCYSPVPLTLPAHSSLFTGRYPLGHKVRNNGSYFLQEDHTTLAEKFKTAGYQTYAVISSYVLMSKFGLNQGFDFYDDSLNVAKLVHDYNSEIKADLVYNKFYEWFSNREKDKKFFAWVHFYDPHRPYEPPEEYRKNISDDDYIGLYDAEIHFMDIYVGKAIELLKQQKVLSDTVVILVGDHGEAFAEHVAFGHSFFCYEENLRVPLIFYNTQLFKPDLRIKDRVNLVDIMPTVLKIFSLENVNTFQGDSFTTLLTGKKFSNQRTFYIESIFGQEEFGWAPLTGIIENQYKYLSLPDAELYDLSKDKDEKNNLFWKKNRLARRMDEKLMQLVKKYSSSQAGLDSKRELSAADKKHLQSLGYVSTFSQKGDSKLDPKKGIIVKQKYDQIARSLKDGNLEKAEVDLLNLRKEYPDILMPQYFGIMDSIYKERKDPGNIIKNWENANKHFPEHSRFILKLATEHFNQKNLDTSEKIISQLIDKERKNSSALILLGRIFQTRGKNQEAIKYFEEAKKIEPLNFSLQCEYAKLCSENNQPQKAGEICDQLLQNEEVKKDVYLKSKLGIILTEIHRNDQAFQLLNEVLTEKKDDAATWNYLGIIHLRQGKFTEAQKALQESIKLDPKIAKTYNNLGTLYLTMFLKNPTRQLHNLAVTTFNKALDIDSELVSALNGRASAYKFVRRTKEALRDWKQVIKIKPDFTDSYFNIAVTLLQTGEKKEALTYLRICQEKYIDKLTPSERQKLTRLIQEASS